MIKDALKRSSKAYLRSALEDAVNNNAGKNFKSQSVINHLKNRGVKPAEIEGAGVQQFVDDNSVNGKVSMDHLGKWIKGNRESNENRPSDLLEVNNSKKHSSVVETDIKNNKEYDYTARVYRKDDGYPITNHFNNDRNYYSHTRFSDKKGSSLRVVHELQSDKHSRGPKRSINFKEGDSNPDDILMYSAGDFTDIMLPSYFDDLDTYKADKIADLASEFTNMIENAVHNNTNIDTSISNARKFFESKLKGDYDEFVGTSVHRNGLLDDIVKLYKETSLEYKSIVDHEDSFLKDFNRDTKYLKNTINKLFVDSFNEKRTTLKIRIADDEKLFRGLQDKANLRIYPGSSKPITVVQHWYETDVKNSVIKIAKSIGAKTSFDGKYLKVVLPAAGFSLPLYARDNKEFMDKAKELKYTPEEIEDFMESKATIMRTNKK